MSFSFIPIRVQKYMFFLFFFFPTDLEEVGFFLEGSELVIDP